MLMLAHPKLNESIKKDVDEIFKDPSRFRRYRIVREIEADAL